MDIELIREEAIKTLPHIDINRAQKIYLDITKMNINEYLRFSQLPENSKIVLREDGKKTKLSLINVYIDIVDPQNRIINMENLLRENEIDKENDLGKSILNILNIDNFGKENYQKIISENKQKKDEKEKIEKKEEKSEEDKKSEKEGKDDNKNEKEGVEEKEEDDKNAKMNNNRNMNNKEENQEKEQKYKKCLKKCFIVIFFFSCIFFLSFTPNFVFIFLSFIFFIFFIKYFFFQKKEEIKKTISDEIIKNFPIIQIKPIINNKIKNDEIIINIDIYGEGLQTLLNQIYEEKQCKNIISILNSIFSIKISDIDNKNIINSNDSENPPTKEIKTNEEKIKIKNMFENMCILGNTIKKEIIEQKKANPNNFISIEEATKNTRKIDELFCIGLLAKNLENFGIITAIEKNPKQDEESIKKENSVLQYILDGLTEKKKYNFYFDFGEDENNKLLNNKDEQEKFHKKLKKKLSLEYNIPEQKIIITNPQKGSYQVSVIFMEEGFNTNIDVNELREKCKNDKEFKEISYLKQIHKTLIMEGCKLSINMLDSRGNKKRGWSTGQKRGGFDYYPPLKGWKGFGLKVLDKYDNGNNDWIANNGNKNEWAVAYHGTGVKMGSSFTLEKATNSILAGGFKAGWGQAYAEYEDARHPGQKVGIGVYCSPNPQVMESYASCAQTSTCINGINFMMGFMMRVKPERIRYSDSQKDYWVLNGTTDEMRPYRIMVKAHGVDDDYLTYINAVNRRNNIGEIFHYNIIGSDSGTVWGDHIYTDDSNIAKAAVIEGLCKIGEEKEVSIKMLKPLSSYNSCFRNGVGSSSYGYWHGSYIFV